MKTMSPTRFIILFMIVIASWCNAENWPRFRGPNGQGIGSGQGFPTSWSEKDYAWTVSLPGVGHSSPIVMNDIVYVTCASKDRNTGYVLALTTSTGQELWRKGIALNSPRMNSLNLPATSTPTADEKNVYTLWYDDDKTMLLAYSHTGKDLWQTEFEPARLTHGPSASLIVYQDMLVFTLEQNESAGPNQSHWYAVDTKTGQIKWTLPRGDTSQASYSTPCVFTNSNKQDWLIFSSSRHGISAINPADGQVAWEMTDALPARVVSCPILAGNLIINTCGAGSSAKQLTAIDTSKIINGKPSIAYTLSEKYLPYVPTAIYVNDRLFLFHDTGPVSCLNASNGQLIWTARPAGRYYSSPVFVDGKIYCMDMDGLVVMIEAGDKYQLSGIVDLGEKTQASIAIANNCMYLRTLSKIRCLNSTRSSKKDDR